MRELLNGLDTRDGASEQALDALGALVGQLPSDYMDFLRLSNGAEGPIGSTGYLVLWPADQIPFLNGEYAVEEFAPGFLLFGSDGGDTAYAFDRRGGDRVVEMPFIGMDPDAAIAVASGFRGFLELLSRR